jgi:GNAT superfamily N-acetyltransferase
MRSRPYRDASDVAALQRFVAEAWTASDGVGYLHPGDVAHHLFSGNRLFDTAEICTIWEDEEGIAAFLIVNPKFLYVDLQIRPAIRNPELERELVAHAERELIRLLTAHGIEADNLLAEGYRDDRLRLEALAVEGWAKGDDPPWVVNRADLSELQEPEVPAGYTIRQVESLDEAGDLATVHAASFGSSWTEDEYRTLMQSPGYSMDHEWVAVADDGEYAAFTVTWRDWLNRTGLFEPVGTHADHRRRGLGKALLLTVLHAMAGEGLEYAIVGNEGTNPGSRALYLSAGFEPWRLHDDWVKPLG